jgi:hypothetical protein
MRTINREFSAISKDRHYVLGNHCVDTLTKAEFLEGVEQKQNNGYSVMEIAQDGTIRLTGFRKQLEYDWNQNA